MYLVTDELTQTPVNKLVSRYWPLALEFGGDDERLEMRVVVAGDFDHRIFKSGLDQMCYFRRVHIMKFALSLRGAKFNRI